MSVIEATTGAAGAKQARARLGMRPRSAVTSGRRQFVSGDPNSAWARRYHDLILGHISDLGGKPNLSEAQISLCKRAAGLEAELEQMEGRMSQGEQVDLDRYGRAASHLRRILESLGITRQARTVSGIEADSDDVQELLKLFSPQEDVEDDEGFKDTSIDVEVQR